MGGRGRIAERWLNGGAFGRDPGRHGAKRSGTAVELTPELGLDPRQRIVVARAEPGTFEYEAGRSDSQGDEQPADDEASGERPHT